MKSNLSFKRYGENAVLIEWPNEISTSILEEINTVIEHLKNDFSKHLVDMIPGYNSLTIIFNNSVKPADLERIKIYCYNNKLNTLPTRKTWQLPVCYDHKFGIDLIALSKQLNLDIETIINLHQKPKYLIHFIGFLPGFMYLGGLNEKLYYPRKQQPRLNIKKGAVGIGGRQTGIYPIESPGGWNIIGNCPLNLFTPKNQNPCDFKSGDFIQFESISLNEHYAIKEENNLSIHEYNNH